MAAEPKVDFATEVLPILREHCFRCHGSKNQEGGFRIDERQHAFGLGDSEERLIAKGKPAESLLIQRLTNPDLGDIMPLDGSALAADEIEVLEQWIADGANWPDELATNEHWAYKPLTRPEVPEVTSPQDQWNSIDPFVVSKLVPRGQNLAPPVNRARLLRRASLALIGLPPSPEAVEAFLADNSPNAYEKAVDRLLQSNRFGERWSVPWLDLARYADSNGFQADQLRDNWAYRDWVIRSMNNDLPYDQFVIEQLAGDLLPNATLDQKIATGFHRMTTCNVEAGVDPEQNRVNQIVDRVNTTATVFMGSTLECAQCHDHKYDPFTQEDYYRLFAYFNNTPLEVKNTGGVTWDFYGPTMDLPLSEEKENRRGQLEKEKLKLEEQRSRLVEDSEAAYQTWLTRLSELSPTTKNEENSVSDIWETPKIGNFSNTGNEPFEILKDGSVLLQGEVPDKTTYKFTYSNLPSTLTAIRIDALTHESIPGKGPGRGDPKRSNIILSEVTVGLRGRAGVPDEGKSKAKEQGKEQDQATEDESESETLKLTLPNADYSQKDWEVEKAIDGNPKTGWAIAGQFGKPHWCSFVFAEPLDLAAQQEDAVSGVQGTSQELQLVVTLSQQFGLGRVIGRPKISWSSVPAEFLTIDASLLKLARAKKRNAKQEEKLRAEFDKSNLPLKKLRVQIAALNKKLEAVVADSTLVMIEEKPRDTFVMLRGEYENKAEQVSAGVPELFSSSEELGKTGDRLELARWLTSESNPLLARVTVNRWWAELFGVGLVNTPEDFGTQSEFPSHPELLDWLASELVDSGWSRKHILRTIVLSKTFQQTAAASTEDYTTDPQNRLLARGPRFRLPAETIRDNALAISGLLSDKMYGPPIMPFQPSNIWRSVGRNQPTWKAAENDDRFRRGVYIVLKRAAPYPSFINFDAPDRGSCTVHRDRTNTPLQALTLLNDPAYAEISLAFA
ncbi:MAG: PSD1 and planctomycete cytochrome C domain-containing protein, partial [Planctomycetota bacterium]